MVDAAQPMQDPSLSGPNASNPFTAELGLLTTMSSDTRKRVQHISGPNGKVVAHAFGRATVLHQMRSKAAKEDFCCPVTSDTQRAPTFLQENTCPLRPKAVVALPDAEAQVMVSGLQKQKSLFRRRTNLLDAGLRSQHTAHPNSYGPGCASSKQQVSEPLYEKPAADSAEAVKAEAPASTTDTAPTSAETTPAPLEDGAAPGPAGEQEEVHVSCSEPLARPGKSASEEPRVRRCEREQRERAQLITNWCDCKPRLSTHS